MRYACESYGIVGNSRLLQESGTDNKGGDA